MEILSEGEMAARLDYKRPLKSEPEERESLWCIPFEWGGNVKGTRISIALAKTISAELRASVAEAEQRELRRYFDRERERGDRASKGQAEAQTALYAAKAEIAELQRRLRAKKRRA